MWFPHSSTENAFASIQIRIQVRDACVAISNSLRPLRTAQCMHSTSFCRVVLSSYQSIHPYLPWSPSAETLFLSRKSGRRVSTLERAKCVFLQAPFYITSRPPTAALHVVEIRAMKHGKTSLGLTRYGNRRWSGGEGGGRSVRGGESGIDGKAW